MSRFNDPLDAFEMDEFDYPVFEAPSRSKTGARASRPNSSNNGPARAGSPRSSVAPRRPGASPSRTTSDRSPAPRNVAAPNRTAPRSNANGARPQNRPKSTTSSVAPGVQRAAKPGEKSKRATPVPIQPQRLPRPKSGLPKATLRAVHYEVAGVLLVAMGVLFGYAALQSPVDGWLPRHALSSGRLFFGVGAFAIPCALLYLGGTLFVRRQNANLRAFWRGAGTAFAVFLTWKALQVPRGAEFVDENLLRDYGGYVGAGFAWVLRRALGEVGAVVSLVALSLVAILLWTESTLGQLSERARTWLGNFFAETRDDLKEKGADIRRNQLEKRVLRDEERQREQTQRIVELEAERDLDWEDDTGFGPHAFDPVDDEDDFEPLPPNRNGQGRLPLKKRPKSPFLPLDDLLADVEPAVAAAPKVEPLPEPEPEPVAAIAPKKRNTPRPRPKTPLEIADIPDVPLEVPQFMTAPRIEIIDAPPPPSVVALSPVPPQATPVALPRTFTPSPVEEVAPDIDLKAVLAGENADTELTPNEALELQAEESARETEELPQHAAIVLPEKPRRRFGEGPLMPEYFDEAVLALDPPIPVDHSGAEEEIQKSVAGVQETLSAFKIDARVTDVKRGPVITRYEVQPGPGVRVASISNLDKDLARSLSALAVRIEAPVPGKNVVGIEIPNKKVHLVRMRDVLEQPDFLAHQSKLAFVLGKDIAGLPKWGDLTKMPHMLIAGSTNSGKSVCLNSIIASILVRARPDEVRFSLIDPKRVELTLYRGIRHLMHDVVVEPKQAVVALRRAIEEMDRRYKLFATRQVRNIASYNAKLQPGEKPMPYIVIVIDELADLMMTAAAEFEKLICRLAQLARATGIHLIVATQRPSVNVITGVIKANIPARIAFAVASQVDSRTILDSVGAERLIGSGDMLYDSNNGGKSTRIQGAFLSEEEVNRIVEVVKAAYQYEDDNLDKLPEFDLYQPDDEDTDFESEQPANNEKRDSLFDEIVEFTARHQEMSASMIQRKFGIGYPRAGRIVDQLERAGILGPPDGPKPRKVLRGSSDDE